MLLVKAVKQKNVPFFKTFVLFLHGKEETICEQQALQVLPQGHCTKIRLLYVILLVTVAPKEFDVAVVSENVIV